MLARVFGLTGKELRKEATHRVEGQLNSEQKMLHA